MEDIIIELFLAGVIKTGKFKLKSGIESPLYCDFRVLLSYPKLMNAMADLLINEMDITEKTCVCGVPYGGIPYASVMSSKILVRNLLVRKEQKTYGSKNEIEGSFKCGDVVYLIEDVTTTGESAKATAKILENAGLQVNILTMLDRRMNRDDNIKCVFTIEQIINVLLKKNMCSREIFDIFTNQEKKCINEKGIKLCELMKKKQSNLCVATDCRTSFELFELIEKVGKSVCLLKTHSDMIVDWSIEVENELNELKNKYEFMWLEDRKFGDIANTCIKQLEKFSFTPDFVTVHSIAGKDTIEELSKRTGVIIISDMSTKGNLCDVQYQKKTYDMCKDISIVGYVGQTGKRNSKYLQFIPGVNENVSGDGKGQQYQDVETKIAMGADVIIVGRGICESDDPEKMAEYYREKGWTMFEKYQMKKNNVDIGTTFVGKKMESCIYNASGVLCTTESDLDTMFRSKSGAVISKSCTISPRLGNQHPRVWSEDKISINSTGLANNGYHFYAGYTPKISKPYFVSVAGTPDELEEIICTIDTKNIDALELNFSCPNIDGKQIGYNLELTKVFLDKINDKMTIPWGIKLPPYFEPQQIKDMANLFNNYSLSFITCCNSLGNGLILSELDKPVIVPRDGLGGIGGGQTMKSICLSNVYQFRKYLLDRIDIIGCGGISSGKDVYDYLLVGAKCVQVGTQLLNEGSIVFERLNNELKKVMMERKYCNICDIVRL